LLRNCRVIAAEGTFDKALGGACSDLRPPDERTGSRAVREHPLSPSGSVVDR